MTKIRQGFVSNSSSSSFIVIRDGDDQSLYISDLTYRIGYNGEAEFGWQIEDHYSVHSKINFSMLQAMYANNDDWKEMIIKVTKEYMGVDEVENMLVIDWDIDNESNGLIDAYIDHESVGGDNTKMFESYETLKMFLFSGNSYIHTDNDNH